jgi:hypothetical protein
MCSRKIDRNESEIICSRVTPLRVDVLEVTMP